MVARYGGRRRRRESFYHTNGGIKVRSKFERTVVNDLESRGIEFGYETLELPWLDTVANGECGECGSEEVGKHCVYTPDVIFPSGSIVEIKGLFTARDRKIAVGVAESTSRIDDSFLVHAGQVDDEKESKTVLGLGDQERVRVTHRHCSAAGVDMSKLLFNGVGITLIIGLLILLPWALHWAVFTLLHQPVPDFGGWEWLAGFLLLVLLQGAKE